MPGMYHCRPNSYNFIKLFKKPEQNFSKSESICCLELLAVSLDIAIINFFNKYIVGIKSEDVRLSRFLLYPQTNSFFLEKV